MRRWLSGPSSIFHFPQSGAENFDVFRATFFAPDRVHGERGASESGFFEEREQHFDDFSIDCRSVGLAENFGADLVELAIAALLRALAAEHRADVVELHVAGESLHAVLDVGAANGGGGFGAQGYRVAEVICAARARDRSSAGSALATSESSRTSLRRSDGSPGRFVRCQLRVRGMRIVRHASLTASLARMIVGHVLEDGLDANIRRSLRRNTFL